MTRNEGEKLLGKMVTGWTSWRGVYIGELTHVKPSRPWRGVIRVVAIADLPDGNRARIIREGEELEVGGVNVKEFTDLVPSYKDSLTACLAHERQFLTTWRANNKVLAEAHSRHTAPTWIIDQREKRVAELESWKDTL